jgi:hypothetical protein
MKRAANSPAKSPSSHQISFFREDLYRTSAISCALPVISGGALALGGCQSVCPEWMRFSHNARAAASGSIAVCCHHDDSSPQQWTSRWCVRYNGTVNSSLTLRPSARDCANRHFTKRSLIWESTDLHARFERCRCPTHHKPENTSQKINERLRGIY